MKEGFHYMVIYCFQASYEHVIILNHIMCYVELLLANERTTKIKKKPGSENS